MIKFKDSYNFKAAKHFALLSYLVTTLGVF